MCSRCADEKCLEFFDLCFKCSGYKDIFHNPSHKFREMGLEFAADDNDEVNNPGCAGSGNGSFFSVDVNELSADGAYYWTVDDINIDDL